MLVLPMCWYRFGQQPRRGAAEPGTAVRRQHDHPGTSGCRQLAVLCLPQACTSLDAVVAGEADRADVQPPPLPVAASSSSAVLPVMVRLPPDAWVISTRRAWVLGETGMVTRKTPLA